MIEEILLNLGLMLMQSFGGMHCGCNPGRREDLQVMMDGILKDDVFEVTGSDLSDALGLVVKARNADLDTLRKEKGEAIRMMGNGNRRRDQRIAELEAENAALKESIKNYVAGGDCAHICDSVAELVRKIAELEAQAVRLYNHGYLAGHHDTVEAQYTDIRQLDIDDYHFDVVDELLREWSDVRK